MTDIRTITGDQFKSAYFNWRAKDMRSLGSRPIKESMAIRNLEKVQAVSFPCRWKHKRYASQGKNATPVCMGVNNFNTLNHKAYRQGWQSSPMRDKKKFRFFCNRTAAPETDPNVYAMRLE